MSKSKNPSDSDDRLYSELRAADVDVESNERLSWRRGSRSSNSSSGVEGCLHVVRIYVAIIGTCALLFVSGYFFRDYLRRALEAIENQNSVAVCVFLVFLYFLVSLPFVWGYIVVNVVTGYLYGFLSGLAITVVAAAIGISAAHSVIKALLVRPLRA